VSSKCSIHKNIENLNQRQAKKILIREYGTQEPTNPAIPAKHFSVQVRKSTRAQAIRAQGEFSFFDEA